MDQTATNRLRSAHQQQLKNVTNNDQNTLEIVRIMGGIDVILTDYLNHQQMTMLLTDNTMNQIHEIIIKPELTDNEETKFIPIAALDDINNDRFYYSFDPNNDFLSTIFSPKTAHRITAIFSHKIFKIIIAFTVIFHSVKDLFCCGNYIDSNIYIINPILGLSIIYILWIPYMIFGLLSVNKTAFKLIIKTFELYFKMYYVVIGIVAQFVWSWNFSRAAWEQYHTFPVLQMVHIVSMRFAFGMFIFLVSLFDGLRIDRRLKCLVSGILAASLLYQSFAEQFELYQSEFIDTVNRFGFDIEIKPIRILSNRIIGIFVMKQFLFTLFRKNKTALIQVKPIIKWTEKKNNMAKEIEMNENNEDVNTENVTKDDVMLGRYVSTEL